MVYMMERITLELYPEQLDTLRELLQNKISKSRGLAIMLEMDLNTGRAANPHETVGDIQYLWREADELAMVLEQLPK